jgi:hypothetical protein
LRRADLHDSDSFFANEMESDGERSPIRIGRMKPGQHTKIGALHGRCERSTRAEAAIEVESTHVEDKNIEDNNKGTATSFAAGVDHIRYSGSRVR